MDYDAEIVGMLMGFFIGIFLTSIFMAIVQDKSLDNCAKVHDVYECEWIVVPVELDP